MADLFSGASFADGLDKLQDVHNAIYQKTKSFEDGLHVPYPFNVALAEFAAVIGLVVYIVIGLVIVILFPILVPIVVQVMGGLLQIRKDTPQEQLELSAASLSEFLGVEISAEQLATGKGVQNSLDVSTKIGEALYNRLVSEFTSNGQVTPESGELAAKRFSGFAINFATQNAMISTLADAASLHLLEDFRELGVEAARNLGLGRLQRLAMGTLLTNVIQKPYDRQLRRRYRPDLMTDTQYIHAYHRNAITEAQLKDVLAQKGYTDADIEQIIIEGEVNLTPSELERLARWKLVTYEQAVNTLNRQGVDPTVSGDQLQTVWLSRADTQVSKYVEKLGALLSAGQISEADFDAALTDVPWSDSEKEWAKKAYLLARDNPTRLITWTELKTAFENGLIDIDYVQRWLDQSGYDDDDQQVKYGLLALDLQAYLDKQQAAQAKADALKAKQAATTPQT
jgi:hypothetical protein